MHSKHSHASSQLFIRFKIILIWTGAAAAFVVVFVCALLLFSIHVFFGVSVFELPGHSNLFVWRLAHLPVMSTNHNIKHYDGVVRACVAPYSSVEFKIVEDLINKCLLHLKHNVCAIHTLTHTCTHLHKRGKQMSNNRVQRIEFDSIWLYIYKCMETRELDSDSMKWCNIWYPFQKATDQRVFGFVVLLIFSLPFTHSLLPSSLYISIHVISL